MMDFPFLYVERCGQRRMHSPHIQRVKLILDTHHVHAVSLFLLDIGIITSRLSGPIRCL
jgi:hypothetical protein